MLMKKMLRKIDPWRPRQTAIPLPQSRQAVHQHQLGLAIIVRDEADYIEEWLEFHLMLGVGHVIVYDNASTDATIDKLATRIRDGIVTVVPWCGFHRRLNNQSLAYAHCLTNFGPRFKWLGFLDTDEFLFPTEQQALPDVIAGLDHLPAIGIPWSMFGSNAHLARPDGPVIANYTSKAVMREGRTPAHAINLKSLVRPKEVVAVQGAHMFHIKDHGHGAFLCDGTWVSKSRKPAINRLSSSAPLQLNHYYTRSEQEFTGKLSKGSVRGPGYFDASRYEEIKGWIECDTVEDTAILRFKSQLESRLAHLDT